MISLLFSHLLIPFLLSLLLIYLADIYGYLKSTIYFGKRGQSLEEIEVVYTLITRLELAKLYTEIDKIDEDAFIIMHSIKDAKGGMIKKRPLK